MFAVNFHIDKVVDNLLILLVLKFQGHRPFGLRVIAVQSLKLEMCVLWNFLDSLERLLCLS
jgi:hypothetical protein